IIRAATRLLESKATDGRELELEVVGRKGRDFFKRRQWKVRTEHVGIFQALRFTTAQRIAQSLIQLYVEHHVDEIHLVYNEFKSVVQQRVIVERLLPLTKMTFDPHAPA